RWSTFVYWHSLLFVNPKTRRRKSGKSFHDLATRRNELSKLLRTRSQRIEMKWVWAHATLGKSLAPRSIHLLIPRQNELSKWATPKRINLTHSQDNSAA